SASRVCAARSRAFCAAATRARFCSTVNASLRTLMAIWFSTCLRLSWDWRYSSRERICVACAARFLMGMVMLIATPLSGAEELKRLLNVSPKPVTRGAGIQAAGLEPGLPQIWGLRGFGGPDRLDAP